MGKRLVLRRAVKVAGDGDEPGTPLKVIPAGTARSAIPDTEMAQLHPDHFEEG